MRGIVRGALAWGIGAVVAVGVGVLALSRIGYGFTVNEMQPLSPEPGDLPATSASPAPSPSSSTSTGPSVSATVKSRQPSTGRRKKPVAPPSRERAVSSPGGSAIVRCAGADAYLVSWSPAQGYYADEVRRGPAAAVSVKFEGRKHAVLVWARCADGIPQPHVVDEEEERQDD